MRFLVRTILHIVANIAALLLAARFVAGFQLGGVPIDIFAAAAVLTLLQLILRPILRFFLSPLVLLTFGSVLIALNAFLLYLLDIWSPALTITGTLPLLYATLIVSVVNTLISVLKSPFLG